MLSIFKKKIIEEPEEEKEIETPAKEENELDVNNHLADVYGSDNLENIRDSLKNVLKLEKNIGKLSECLRKEREWKMSVVNYIKEINKED